MGRKSEVAHGSVEHQQRSPQSVGIIHQASFRMLDQPGQFPAVDQIPGAPVLQGPSLQGVGSGHGCFQQFPGPTTAAAGAPHCLTCHRLHRPHTGFAAAAPLHHGLHGFQSPVAIRAPGADTHHQGLLHPAAYRQFQGRQPPGHWQGGSGQHRKLQLPGGFHHFPGLCQTERLIPIDRNRPQVLLEHLHHRLNQVGA